MDTRSITYEEVFAATPERVFALLHTPSAICAWWSTTHAIVIPEAGGTWTATWGGTMDEPDYTSHARIREFDPPRRFVLGDYVYRMKSGGLPFDADFETAFDVHEHPDGVRLVVTNSGSPTDPIADDFYAGCVQGWKDTFAGIRRFLEP